MVGREPTQRSPKLDTPARAELMRIEQLCRLRGSFPGLSYVNIDSVTIHNYNPIFKTAGANLRRCATERVFKRRGSWHGKILSARGSTLNTLSDALKGSILSRNSLLTGFGQEFRVALTLRDRDVAPSRAFHAGEGT